MMDQPIPAARPNARPKPKPATAAKPPKKQRKPSAGEYKAAALKSQHSHDALSPQEMDAARRMKTAYEYLTHLEETKLWMQACLRLANEETNPSAAPAAPTATGTAEAKLMSRLGVTMLDMDGDTESSTDGDVKVLGGAVEGDSTTDEVEEEELPPASELEEALRNGVYLIRLALFFNPEAVSKRHCYDTNQKIFNERGLQFRHTENIIQWIKAMKAQKFPEIFYPETTDVYDKKNMPKVIYCIHALSKYLHHLGIGPAMEDLTGKATFTEEEISAMDAALSEAGIQMPQFGKIGGILAGEIGEDAAAVHAAVLGINQAVRQEAPAPDILQLLQSLTLGFEHVSAEASEGYRSDLIAALAAKIAASSSSSSSSSTGGGSGAAAAADAVDSEAAEAAEGSENDIYDENLTREEIQKTLNTVNAAASAAAKMAAEVEAICAVLAAVDAQDVAVLAAALAKPELGLFGVRAGVETDYMATLAAAARDGATGLVSLAQIQDAVDGAHEAVEARNAAAAAAAATAAAIVAINDAVVADDAGALLAALQASAAGIVGARDGSETRYLALLAEQNAAAAGGLEQAAIQGALDTVHSKAAALTSIQDAVSSGDAAALLAALHADAAGITSIDDALGGRYLAAFNVDGAAPAALGDAQKILDEVNAAAAHESAIAAINDAVSAGDERALLASLKVAAAAITGISDECSIEYLAVMLGKDQAGTPFTKDVIQGCVTEANHIIGEQHRADAAIAEINSMLFGESDATAAMAVVRQHTALLELPTVAEGDAAHDARYHGALVADAKVAGNLSQKDIRDGLKRVNAEVAVIAAIQDGDAAAVLESLTAAPLELAEVRPEMRSELCDFTANCGARYWATLLSLQEKVGDSMMGIPQFQTAVHETNAAMDNERAFAEAVAACNVALVGGNPEATIVALLSERLSLTGIDEAGAEQYHIDLAAKGAEVGDALTREQLQESIDHTNFVAEENAKHQAALFGLNVAIRKGKAATIMKCLNDEYTRVSDVQEKCEPRYVEALATAQLAKETEEEGTLSMWKQFASEDGRPYYHNSKTKETLWMPPVESAGLMLLAEDLQDVINHCNADQARWEMFEGSIDQITSVQSHVRGYLAKKAFCDRKAFIESQGSSVVKIQALTRMVLQRKRFQKRLAYLNAQDDAALRIQAGFKGMKVRQNYKGLTKVVDPPVNTVRRFLHLLDQSEIDFNEELQVGMLKAKVVTSIKRNSELEVNVNDMDIKIGLLIKNRIELQDVVERNKQLKKMQSNKGRGSQLKLGGGSRSHGLKAMNAESRARLASYEHMFYLLQTDPAYLASLVFTEVPLAAWSGQKAVKFLERVIMAVYNYASAAREEYLLLKLFQLALRKEVFEKIDTTSEFQTSNPMVVKLIVNHYRGEGSGSYLAKVLSPLITPLLHTDLNLNVDPVDVYRAWINEQERETGEKVDLPYEVERDDAMQHQYVREKIAATYAELFKHVAEFLDAIVGSIKDMPFGLRYSCMCLKQDLAEKFPETSEDELLKMVGNVVYYRFFNAAIIAPDGFKVLSEKDADFIGTHPVPRRNLATIARMLQHAASGQTYGDSEEKSDAFFEQAWCKFRAFFAAASEAVSSEQHFSIDEYSDVTMLSKPTVFLSPAEIYYTHAMLEANLDAVAKDAEDPIREILQDLGEAGAESDVLGEADSDQREHSNGEMSLTLANKFEVPEGEDQSVKALMVRTKRFVVDVIRYQQGKNLKQILETEASQEQEESHRVRALDMLAKQKEIDAADEAAKASAVDESPTKTTIKSGMRKRASMKRTQSVTSDDGHVGGLVLSLQQIKDKIVEGALELEKHGLCSSSNNFQDLLNSVAQDIRNQRIYRKQRKQELRKLEGTLVGLDKKRGHMDGQIEQYDLYIGSCMSEITKKKKKAGGFSLKRFGRGKKAKGAEEEGFHSASYKYGARRLMDKGVLISVDNVDGGKLKLASIAISCDSAGIFKFNASVLGVTAAEEAIAFQDLLELQYNNVTTHKFFTDFQSPCTVNVNLLIFLINKKFYNK